MVGIEPLIPVVYLYHEVTPKNRCVKCGRFGKMHVGVDYPYNMICKVSYCKKCDVYQVISFEHGCG